jgi:hypothetical protein
MPYQATTFNVMIASPSDVAAERAAVRQALADWNVIHSASRRIVLLPIGWETHSSPQMGQHPQKVLNEQLLARSDLLIGVFWTRIGTPTPTHASGSVEEIEEHISAGKPTMLYFSNQPVRLDSVDNEQYTKLSAFKASCKQRGLFEEYLDLAEFREKFFRHLQLKLNDDPYFAVSESRDPIVAFAPSEPDLSPEAKVLLVAAAKDDGIIMKLAYLGGTDVQAGGRNFIESKDRRSVAKWEAAVEELEREGLTEDKAGKNEVYFVTHEGYRVADTLSESV